MSKHPLTDPNSLICYRLANGQSSRRATARRGGPATPLRIAWSVLGLIAAIGIVLLFLRLCG